MGANAITKSFYEQIFEKYVSPRGPTERQVFTSVKNNDNEFPRFRLDDQRVTTFRRLKFTT